MRKKRKSAILIALIIVIIIVFGYAVKAQKKQVQFYFYDGETNCSLNGYVFSDSKLIGKTQEGYFNLTYENYKANINAESNLSLFGKLGSCFQENAEFLFDRYWRAFEIEEYYFEGESVFNFKTKINPHNPAKRELIGFIQASKVNSELNNINTDRKSTLNDLSKINMYLNDKINYTKDWDFNNETNYWQTPVETLKPGKGDCEEFSTTLLSLFLAYNSSLNCYNIIFSSHVTTFCSIEDYYVYYDQEKTELKKQIENKDGETKIKLLQLNEEYFEYYGINNSEIAYYAFSDKELIEFENSKEFVDWQYSLDKKAEFNLFEKLEKETSEVEKNYSGVEEAELATEKPKLATEEPTLKGFFIENSAIIIILGAIFIVLIIILIKLNIKKES